MRHAERHFQTVQVDARSVHLTRKFEPGIVLTH